MAKEWILNSAMNRFQLNFARNVGKVSEAIRQCSPRSVTEWETYYFSNIRSREHIEGLGRKLFIKITEVIESEVESITEEDCINYIVQLVIDRTFDGYSTEIRTIYGQLEQLLNIAIEPAPDEFDRHYNVDFVIKVGHYQIGLQIKPISNTSHIPEIYKERGIASRTHKKFTDKFGGKVFYVVSIKEGGNKKIYNTEVVSEIEREIERLNMMKSH